MSTTMQLKLDRKRRGLFLRRILADLPKTPWHAPLTLLSAWYHGYSTQQILYHGLQPAQYADYFPDLDRYVFTIRTNQQVWPILHDKLIFDAFMSERLPIIPAVAVCIQGQYIPLRPEGEPEALLSQLIAGHSFMVKPLQGGKGQGIRRLSATGEQLHWGSQRLPWAEIQQLWAGLDAHLLVPFKSQHPTLATVYPDASNTLRLTVFKPRGHAVQFFSPLLRVGTDRSAPLDNFSQGGLLCAIDWATGRVTQACIRDAGYRRHIIHQHPDTGVELIGLSIPFWSAITARLSAFHDHYPCFDWVGWDVLIGEQAWWVIEGNHNPDLDLPFSFTTRREHPELDRFMRALYEDTPPC